jgi:tRNA nucleotidyltransferase/poly(A) polymerase
MKIQNWNKYIEMPYLKHGIEILHILKPYGVAYIVGGTVRDLILNRVPKDIDVCTNVPIDVIESLFLTHDIGANKTFGILVVEYKGDNFEIAQFRTEDVYSDGRRPDKVTFVSTFKEDATRRDFTINSLAIDYEGNILDYYNGIEDIKNGIIRTVGDPDVRFKEDYLRLIRAIRFSCTLRMVIESNTITSIRNNAHNITNISQERITSELLKMANKKGTFFAFGIITLLSTKLLQYVLPEIYLMNNFEHSPEHHPEGNVLVHTIAALVTNEIKDPILNWCILFHDVGKIKTFELMGGKITYHKHDIVGSKMIHEIAERMKLDNNTRDAMKFCAKNHMKIHGILEMKKSKIIRLMNSPYWDILVQV